MNEEFLKIFKNYPIGKIIHLKDDYPQEINIVIDYESSNGEWYLKLNNGTKVNVKRMAVLEL